MESSLGTYSRLSIRSTNTKSYANISLGVDDRFLVKNIDSGANERYAASAYL